MPMTRKIFLSFFNNPLIICALCIIIVMMEKFFVVMGNIVAKKVV